MPDGGSGFPGDRALAVPRDALWLLAMSAGVRLALALGTDITYDEAYYWTWSRSLASSYFDHPPMVAWLIRLLGVRGSALACGVATVALVQGFAADLTGRPEVGWRAAALWSVLPASVLAGVFATPDAPLMVFWTGALWALHRRAWVIAGALAGLALRSKYTAVLLLAPAAIAWLQSPRRDPLRFLAGVAAAVALFAPVLAWNAARGWASFRFQLDHGLVGEPESVAAGTGLHRLLEFGGGQLAVGGLVLPLGVAWMVRARETPLWLRSAFLAPVSVFALASLFAPGQANWAAVAYVAPCAWIAAGWRWPARAAAALGALVCLVGLVHLTSPLLRLPRDAALERTHGWRELRALRAEGAAVVFAPNFGLAAEVAYHSGLPVAIAGASRLTQFDFWPAPALEQGQEALFVSEWDQPPPEALTRAFQSVEGPALLESGYRGRRLHTFHLWRLRSKQVEPDRQRPPVARSAEPD